MNETTPTPPQPPAPPLPPKHQPAAPTAQPPKDFTDVYGIISIIMIFLMLHLPGFIIGLIGVGKAKRTGQSTVLSRIGWITNLVLMILVIIGVTLFFLLVVALAHNSDRTKNASNFFDTSKSLTSNELRTDRGEGFTLSVPTYFKDLEEEYRNKDAIYSQGSDMTNEYAMVIKEAATDFSDGFTVDDYAALVNNSYPTRESLSNAVVTPLSGVENPHGLSVKDFQVTGDTSGVKVVFYVRYVKAGPSFYQVIGWTNPSSAANTKATLTSILQSFNAV